MILWTYDMHETGVVEDLIDGGTYVAATWFIAAHPWPLKCLLDHMAWQPELTGASRENHIMRSTAVVTRRSLRQGANRLPHLRRDRAERRRAAAGVCAEVGLGRRQTACSSAKTLSENGYTVKPLPNGDCIVTIRHDGCRKVVVEGDDPQETAEDDRLQYEGAWTVEESPDASGGKLHVAETAGASVSFEFEGNQVRLIGPRRSERRPGRRLSRRREAALRHRLLVPSGSRSTSPLLQERPCTRQAHVENRGLWARRILTRRARGCMSMPCSGRPPRAKPAWARRPARPMRSG